MLEEKLKLREDFQPATGVLIPVVRRFLNQKPGEHQFTHHEISYIRELYQEIENLDPDSPGNFFSTLDECLIYMNFNHRLYADSLLQRLSKDVSSYEREDKMEYLLVRAKAFRQLPQKPGAIFSKQHPDLIKTLLNWFRHEIMYLEKSMDLSLENRSKKDVPPKTKSSMCPFHRPNRADPSGSR